MGPSGKFSSHYGCLAARAGRTVYDLGRRLGGDGVEEAASPLTRLPVVYALALALRDAGLGPEEIAARLGVRPASMPHLLEIAVAKLAALD